MEKKKTLRPLISVLLCFTLGIALSLVWHATRPQTEFGEKHIIVEVTHSRGSTAEFTYDTGEDSQVGVDEVVIHDGDRFTWTYTTS